jgi:hypothetical protein
VPHEGGITHAPLVQVAPAPAQGVQLVVPQLFTLVLEEQALPQRWVPAGQVLPQAVPLQVAVPPVGAAHTAQVAPHELILVLVLETQAFPQA